jgi:hypothetical protein
MPKEQINNARQDRCPQIAVQQWHSAWFDGAPQAGTDHHISRRVMEHGYELQTFLKVIGQIRVSIDHIRRLGCGKAGLQRGSIAAFRSPYNACSGSIRKFSRAIGGTIVGHDHFCSTWPPGKGFTRRKDRFSNRPTLIETGDNHGHSRCGAVFLPHWRGASMW